MAPVPKKATLLLATYEMPHHLKMVCARLECQSSRDFEIMICDDGSGPRTKCVIDEFISRSPVPVKHLWQEHTGFRKCRILNRAIRESQGEVLIFLDGDCIPHRHFIADHIQMQEAGYYLAGRRMELGPKISQWLSSKHVHQGFFDFPQPRLIVSVLDGESDHLQRSFRVSWDWLRSSLRMKSIIDLKGCNFSVDRRALEAINGFDEAYEGYGREDTDVELRLKNLGYKIKSLKGLALQFHLWHPRREFTPANEDLLEEVKRTGRIKCQLGLINL